VPSDPFLRCRSARPLDTTHWSRAFVLGTWDDAVVSAVEGDQPLAGPVSEAGSTMPEGDKL
jgi:hypothetical protein